jgi:hypothetical protein
MSCRVLSAARSMKIEEATGVSGRGFFGSKIGRWGERVNASARCAMNTRIAPWFHTTASTNREPTSERVP